MRVVFDYGIASPGARPPRAAPPPSSGAPRTASDSGAPRTASDSGAPRTASDSGAPGEAVVVVRLGPAAEQHGANPANRGSANPPVDGASGTGGRQRGEDGIAVPGTDYRLETSEAARERDREVRLHEQAHLRSLGRYAASGVRYTTRTGPDGESYAVGGSIKADLSEVPGDPRATLQKAQAVQRAALAPGSPSGADMKVAAEAYRLARDAREALEETHGLDVRR